MGRCAYPGVCQLRAVRCRKSEGRKITHMILRLFYIIIILTGAELFVRFANWNGEYAGKMLLGIITIGLMEMLVIRKKKANQPADCGSVLLSCSS